MEILCMGEENYILDLEIKAIKAFDSILNGYNLVLGNPRTGGYSHSEETKDRISESLNYFHDNNVAWNKGITIGRREEYLPCYVSGFWFPHPEDARNYLNMNIKTFYSRKNKGTLGDTRILKNTSIKDVPNYVAGFWFDNLYRAEEKLGVSVSSLSSRIRRGNIEEKNLRPSSKIGNKNPMCNKLGKDHPNSKPVYVNHEFFYSIADAVRNTEFTKKIIYNSIKKKLPGFYYAEEY